MTDLPHFGLPFRFVNGAAVVLEQDTTDEILTCVLAVLLCPKGFRVELPDFGIDDPTFTETAPNASDIELALTEWEPRSQEIVDSNPSAVDELVSYVTVRTGMPSDD